MGAKSFRNSAPLEHVLKQMGIPLERQNYIKLGNSLFESLGKEILAHAWIHQIHQLTDGHKLFIIDGLRYPEEAELYRTKSNFVLVAVRSDDETRYDRSKHASDSHKEADSDYAEFLRTSSDSDQEKYIDQLMQQADFSIDNNGSLQDLQQSVERMVANILRD